MYPTQIYLPMILIFLFLLTLTYAINIRKRNDKTFYETRKVALVLCQEILELVNLMQKHRGMSSGIIGGNNGFKVQINKLSSDINGRLASIMLESKSYPQLFDYAIWDDIQARWQNKCQQWPDYELIHNVENHSYLIRIILDQVNVLTDRAGITTDASSKVNKMAREILRELPELVEYIGQMRALSVHSASAQTCSTDSKLHLRYLHQSIHDGVNKPASLVIIPDQIKAQLDQLLDLVETKIIKCEKIDIDADDLFQLCTKIIDAYLDISKSAITNLKKKVFAIQESY
jgi:hypothetical protein